MRAAVIDTPLMTLASAARQVRWPRGRAMSMLLNIGRCRTGLNTDVLAHNPEVAGSNPAPATRKYEVRGLIAGNGGRAFWLSVGGSLAGQDPGVRQVAREISSGRP